MLNQRHNGEFELIGDYVNLGEKALFLHKPCGNIISKRCGKMVMTNPEGCYICNGKNKWKTTSSFQTELNKKYGDKYTVLGEYKKAREPLLVRDNDCGHEFMISPDNLLRGRGCPLHSKQHSSYMKNAESIFMANDIMFEREKRYSDCINPETGRMLPFDYYLPEYNTLVEVDGEFHFNRKDDFNPWWDFEGTSFRDGLKTKYCLDKNIRLIRLPYFENERFEDIILENLYANTEVTHSTKYGTSTVTHSG